MFVEYLIDTPRMCLGLNATDPVPGIRGTCWLSAATPPIGWG